MVTGSELDDIVQRVRDLVQGETKLVCSTSDEFLLRFIRASKYNIQKSHQLVKDYFRAKFENPEEFVFGTAGDYESIISRLELGFVVPGDDFKGRRIILLRLGDIDPSRECWDSLMQSATLVLESLSLEPIIQETGVCFIIDCTHFSLKIMKWATPHKLRIIMKFLQDSIPLRFEILHIVNAPLVFNIFFAALKPFMKENFVDKLIWHKAPYRSLHNYMEPCYIPRWLGGDMNVEDIRFWYRDVIAKADLFKEYSTMGY